MKKFIISSISVIYFIYIILLVKDGNINFMQSFWLLLYGTIVSYCATKPEQNKEKTLKNTIKELQNHIKKLNTTIANKEDEIRKYKLEKYTKSKKLQEIKEILQQNNYSSDINTINKIRELIRSSKED